jgi:FAD:protein FMN transferase
MRRYSLRLGFRAYVLLGAFLAGTSRGAETSVRYEATHEAMGTVFMVAAYGPDAAYLAEVVNQVFEEIDSLDRQMSNYKPESELSVINRQAASGDVIVEPAFFSLLQDSLRYSAETGGAFDITVGPLMKEWGFFRGHGRVPSQAEIAKVLERVGYKHVKLDSARRTIRFDESGVEIDLGGIAKGYAVDRAVEILRSNHLEAALVSSGTSSIYALGSPPGQRGWKVTLRDPFDAHKVGDTIHLQNYSLSTSGSYEKFFKVGGKTYCHIMNPHTGWPVDGMLSTAVMASSTLKSEALSKPFFIWGAERSRPYLRAHPELTVLFYLPQGHSKAYKRVLLRSDSFRLPPECVVEVGK